MIRKFYFQLSSFVWANLGFKTSLACSYLGWVVIPRVVSFVQFNNSMSVLVVLLFLKDAPLIPFLMKLKLS